jgi:type 2 lantibiotic biosynthesis protein LanM
MIATFESGFQIVYKPKSLKIDQHFQELLLWLNDKGCHPPLQTMTVLDRGEYGWVEFVQYQSCQTRAELERFFQRHGAYLALLYALNSNDFHYENLIAAGEHPLLIDLETLLQPSFDIFDETQAEFAAEKVMAESVLQVGLLPMRMWSSDDYAGIDISGLGGMTGQLSPDRLPQLTDVGTDAMRYIRQRVEIAGVANRPSLNGVEASPIDYVAEIVTGFTTMYHLLVAHRDELLARSGPLERFSHDEIRVLLRPTRTYDQLLAESFHPDLLHDALDRQLFLERLWMAATIRPYLAQVIASEQADLQRGDIPIFTTHPNSLELFGNSEKGIGGVLYETGMSAVRRRIAQLNEQDMNRQLWFIRASIATLDTSNATPPVPVVTTATASSQRKGEKPDRARLLAGVQAIVDQLATTAIYGAEDVTWIGIELLNQQTWALRQISASLSSGLCGVTLFLAYAGAMTGNESYTLLARRALKTILSQVELYQDEMAQIGAFEGWGGILYTMTHLSIVWGDESIVAQATDIVEIISNLVTQDEQFNIGRGSAGALITLLDLYRVKAIAKVLDVAILCGDHLLNAAKSTEQEGGWESLSQGQTENEFLYGSMGICWALLELAAVTGDERYALAAKATLTRNAMQGASTVENSSNHELFSALGKGLASLALLRHIDGPMVHAQLQMIVASLPVHEIVQSRSLAQGEIGVLDLLLLASVAQNNDHYTTAIEHLGAQLLERIERQNWQCSSPAGIEIPGLMTGLSGLGYELLRLAEPIQVPSVLMLAPPPSTLA